MEHFCWRCMKQLPSGAKFCTSCGYDLTAAAAPDPHHLIPGTRLRDRYIVGNVLGEGGFGITYVGWDTLFGIKVAIKEFYMAGYVSRINTYSPSVQLSMGNYAELFEKSKGRFLDEARVLVRFRAEDGIVGIQDFFRENNTAYIVMDFLDGETLKSYLKRSGTLSWEKTRNLMLPVLRSLSKIHAHHIIHRDISPDNIMLTRDGKVKLLDFGAARDYSGGEGKSLSVILKPGFAPEEQYRTKGQQGPWTDVYALCATMYRCLTGITPDESMERLVEDNTKPPAALSACPKAVSDVLMKGLAVSQRDRIQTVDALLAALAAAESGRPMPAPTAPDADAAVFAGNRPTQPADPEATVFSGAAVKPAPVSRPAPQAVPAAKSAAAEKPAQKKRSPAVFAALLALVLILGAALGLIAADVIENPLNKQEDEGSLHGSIAGREEADESSGPDSGEEPEPAEPEPAEEPDEVPPTDMPAEDDYLYIPVIAKGFQHQYWQAVYAGAHAAAENLGVDIYFDGPASQSDIAGQVNMVEQELVKDPAALVLAALDSDAFAPVLEECASKGIPVIGLESGVPGDTSGAVKATVCTSNELTGSIAASKFGENADLVAAMQAATPDAPVTIAVLSQDALSGSVVGCTTGFVNTMTEIASQYGTVAVIGHDMWRNGSTADASIIIEVAVSATSNAVDIQNSARHLLAEANLFAVFCTSEQAVSGFLSAVSDGEALADGGPYEDLIVAGFGAGIVQKAAVRSGAFYGSVAQDPFSMGYLAVEQAVAAANGEAVMDMDCGAIWYDASNMDNESIAFLLYD